MKTEKILYENIPVVPLKAMVILPGEIIHFDVSRQQNVRALKKAYDTDGYVFVTLQTDAAKKESNTEEFGALGTICRLRQLLTLPGDSIRVMLQGQSRAMLDDINADAYISGNAMVLNEKLESAEKAEAFRRRIVKMFAEYCAIMPRISKEAADAVLSVEHPGEFTDAVANMAFVSHMVRQSVLQTVDILPRMALVLKIFSHEMEILKVDKHIQTEVKKRIDKHQKDYYLREQLKVIRAELGDGETAEADKFLEKLKKKQMPAEVHAKLKNEIERYRDMPPGSHELPQLHNYIECMLDLPWIERSEDNLDIENARKILDKDHYGLEKVKERVVEQLAVARLTGKVAGQIICFVGPPGVGKTSIASSVAKALGRDFVRMSLGGIHDEAEIRGHRRTYVGAMPGRVIAAMRQAGTVNPVILFDEIDKLTSDMRGDPAAAMLEVLDNAQNFAFRDHFLEMPYDLSNVMFITTANNADAIPAPLLDRMELIEVSSYLLTEKREIAKRHLLPKQMEKHGIKRSRFQVSSELLEKLIACYTRESGVRELERALAKLCRKAAVEIAEGKHRIKLTATKLREYMGPERYLQTPKLRNAEVGVVNGLAWTRVGGELLEVEVQLILGSGQLSLTGKLGEVMQESAKAAFTYVKAHAEELGVKVNFDKTDIHIHVPEGAVPKDGPSAGVTMLTALTSALTKTPARADVAMTGEITLRGRVLPIGGLKEKLLAAARAGIKEVIIPEENRKDVLEVPEEVRNALIITYAKEARDVLAVALLKKKYIVNIPVHDAYMETV